MKAEKVDIKLKYSGPEVDDGSMSVEDFIEAVKGFSNVYCKIASSQGKSTHNIRINGIEKGSVDILLVVKEAVDHINKNGDTIQNIASAIEIGSFAGQFVIGGIISLIQLVKHIKKDPYTAKPTDTGFVSIKNSKNVTIQMPFNYYKIYAENPEGIKNDLYKIVKPLEEGKINETSIEAQYNGNKLQSGTISYEEKEYFDTQLEPITKTERVWVQGMFNSLTKTTSKGFFYLQNGERVPYEFIENFDKLKSYFFEDSPVEVLAVAHLDQSLKTAKLDIYDIRGLQKKLFDEPK